MFCSGSPQPFDNASLVLSCDKFQPLIICLTRGDITSCCSGFGTGIPAALPLMWVSDQDYPYCSQHFLVRFTQEDLEEPNHIKTLEKHSIFEPHFVSRS